MAAAEQYKKLATELSAKAHAEQRPKVKAELVHLAQSYLRLAEQAERNARCDVMYAPGFGSNLGGEPA
jgi:hypothetical protein